MFFFVSPRFIHRLALTRSAPGGAVSVGEGVVYSGLLKLYMVPVAQEVDCYPPGKSLSGADSSTVQRITRLDSDLFDCVTCFNGFSYSILATRISSLDLGHVYGCFF